MLHPTQELEPPANPARFKWEAEHGMPEPARILQRLVSENHGLLIAAPEQNGGYTSLLKNSIDWISRPDSYHPCKLPVLPGKICAKISASPFIAGGLGSQDALDIVLHRLGILVVPTRFDLDFAHRVPDTGRQSTNSATEELARQVGSILVEVTCRLIDHRLKSWNGVVLDS